jgi:hypothetical protein
MLIAPFGMDRSLNAPQFNVAEEYRAFEAATEIGADLAGAGGFGCDGGEGGQSRAPVLDRATIKRSRSSKHR